MLNIAPERTFNRTITAMAPVDGGHVEEKFQATFRVLDTETSSKFDTFKVEGTRDFLKAAIVRLDDIAGADGKPVPYSDAVRDQVINIPYARLALIHEYFAGVGKAKEGN